MQGVKKSRLYSVEDNLKKYHNLLLMSKYACFPFALWTTPKDAFRIFYHHYRNRYNELWRPYFGYV